MTSEQNAAIEEVEKILAAGRLNVEPYAEPEIPAYLDIEWVTPRVERLLNNVIVYHDLMDREINGLRVFRRTGETAPVFWTLSLPHVLRTRLVFSRRAIAIISSLLLATVASLSSLVYGALTDSWLALWGGSCLLALVVYEILRLNRAD